MKNQEFKFIDSLEQIIKPPLKKNDIGIGDDCALLHIGSKKILMTVDTMVEGVHFLREYDPKIVGERLATVNVSDIASCGGSAFAGVVALEVPKNFEKQWIRDLYKGLKKAQKRYGFSIVGGNVTSGENLSLSLTLLGETKRFVGRDKAKEGDSIFITGYTGLSKRGLELILKNQEKNPFASYHLKPKARIDVSDFLVKHATCAIDISDGLIQDLGHLCTKSKVSINLHKKNFPLSKKLVKDLGEREALQYALIGGEDYEIAFGIKKCDEKLAFKEGFLKIGEVFADNNQEVFLDKKKTDLEGFNHIK